MNCTAVVILNWNGELLLKEFLPIVVANNDGYDIVVVDNFSSDDSVAFVKREFPYVHILQLDMNYGFAGGYNRALKVLDYEYVILLNSDVAPSSGWINPLVQILEANNNIAVAVPKIMDYKNPTQFEYAGAAGGFIDYLGYPFCRGRIFDTLEVDSGQYNDSIELFWASGAAFAVKRSVFIKVGGFDEDFFAHQEEIDLCWRIQKVGGIVQYAPESCVYHLGGGTLSQDNPRKTYLNFRNGLYMILKNQDSKTLFVTLLKRMLLDGVAAVRFLLSLDYKNFWSVLKAHIYFYLNFMLFYRKRKELSNIENAILPKHILRKSIVFQYFILKKKYFGDL